MKKRMIAMILVISMIFALLPTYVGAVDSNPFKDVNESDWFYNEVLYAYEQGLMKGIENDVFGPNETTTRAMVVTILYRLEGSPAVDTACTFRDVKAGEYYEAPVIWAAANNIVNGYDPKTFAPNDFITREQLATILYRYASYKGYDVSAAADLSAYEDADLIDDYAQAAMEWANAAELISGTTSTILRPLGNATRAQVAVIFKRLCKEIMNTGYVVSFVAYGTNKIPDQIVQEGELVTMPTDLVPPLSDFCLVGWYSDEEFEDKFDFSSGVYSDICLYAKWVYFDSDADEDGISNYDEINVYGTDPDNFDSDGDGVPDGSELKLGIDPLNGSDGETFFVQNLSEEEIDFNTTNDDYAISVELNAQNSIEDALIIKNSPYSVMIKENRAVIGTPVDIEYYAGEIESGKITFNLDESFVSSRPEYFPNHKSSFDRFAVLYFDTEMHILVPIECEYDEANLSISVSSDNIGNLVLIDYEAMMYDLGIEPEEEDVPERPATKASYLPAVDIQEEADNNSNIQGNENVADNSSDCEVMSYEEFMGLVENDGDFEEKLSEELNLKSNTSTTKKLLLSDTKATSTMRQVDLVLMIDVTGSMGSAISNVKNNILNLIDKLRADNISLYVSIISFEDITCDGIDSTRVNNGSGKEFLNNPTEMYNVVNSLSARGGGDTPETDIDALGRAVQLSYRSSAQKVAFLITDTGYKINNNYGYTSLEQVTADLAKKGVVVSAVTGSSEYSTLLSITGGERFNLSGNFCNEIYNFIKKLTPREFVLIGNNLLAGSFKEPLTYGGRCDTDEDSLTDSDEVDWGYIDLNKRTGEYELYTWEELCKKWLGLGRYGHSDDNRYYKMMKDILIIPAFSNPFSADTDGDYYPDNIDDKALSAKPMYVCDGNLRDGYGLGIAPSYSTPTEYTDGCIRASESVAPFNTREYTFIRNAGSAEFSLTPEVLSYYRISGGSGATVKVYKKGNLFRNDTLIAAQADGSYLLSKGKQYKIVTSNSTPGQYTVTIRQDNWASIPDGGIWERSSVTSAFADPTTMPLSVLYITEQKLIKALNEYTTTNGKYKVVLIESPEDVKDKLSPEDYNWLVGKYKEAHDDGNALTALIVNSSISGIGLGFSIAGAFVKSTVVTAGGIIAGVITFIPLIGVARTILDQYDFEDAITNGEMNVRYNMYIPSFYNNYEPWNENRGFAPKIYLGNPGTVRELTVEDVRAYCGFN